MPIKAIDFDLDNAIRLYRSGMSFQKVGKEIGVSAKTIRRRMIAAGVEVRARGQTSSFYYRNRVGDLSVAVERYIGGEPMTSVCKDFGITRRRLEMVVRDAGHVCRTLRQSVGLRYGRLTARERQSLVAKAHIAKKGQPASSASQERRAQTMEATLQLASRADLILGVWLAQRGVTFTPQRAAGPYNIDIAIHEPAVAVEVNGDWHYFPGRTAAESKRRDYLLNRGWLLIEVQLSKTTSRPWKWLRPACADKIVSLLQQARQGESCWGKHCVIGGDGEALP